MLAERRSRLDGSWKPRLSTLPSSPDASRLVTFTSYQDITSSAPDPNLNSFPENLAINTNYDSNVNSPEDIFNINNNILETILSRNDQIVSDRRLEEDRSGSSFESSIRYLKNATVYNTSSLEDMPFGRRTTITKITNQINLKNNTSPENSSSSFSQEPHQVHFNEESQILEMVVPPTSLANAHEINPVPFPGGSGSVKVVFTEERFHPHENEGVAFGPSWNSQRSNGWISRVTSFTTSPAPPRKINRKSFISAPPRIVSIKDLQDQLEGGDIARAPDPRPSAPKNKSPTSDDTTEVKNSNRVDLRKALAMIARIKTTTGRPVVTSTRGISMRKTNLTSAFGQRRTSATKSDEITLENAFKTLSKTAMDTKFNLTTLASIIPFMPVLTQNRKCVPPHFNLCAGIMNNLTTLPSVSAILDNSKDTSAFEFVR